MLKNITLTVVAISLLSFSTQAIAAEEKHASHDEHHSEAFDPSTFILEHIADSYVWPIWGHNIAIPLPVILYSQHSGFHVFMSSHLAHGHHYKDFMIAHEGEYAGKIVEIDHEGHEIGRPFDLSITRNIASMILSVIIILWMFLAMAKSYRKAGISSPKGIQGFLEPIVLFIRDDIAKPNIGHKYEKFMPYLLTVFFFIWINNLIGLIPSVFLGGSNVTGNIAVTMTLAVITFLITTFSGNKSYWTHIFNTPGVPWWLKVPIPLMPLVEIVGIFSKPFALMVRLFANITAGHIIILSLFSIIFIFENAGMAAVSVPFALFMNVLELLVAVLQAYVFTLLSALFIGLAVEEHH